MQCCLKDVVLLQLLVNMQERETAQTSPRTTVESEDVEAEIDVSDQISVCTTLEYLLLILGICFNCARMFVIAV